METNLEQGQIARIFSLYGPGSFVYITGHGKFKMRGCTWEVFYVVGKPYNAYQYGDAWLLLTPLSKISDEDAYQVAKLEGYSEERLGSREAMIHSGRRYVEALLQNNMSSRSPLAVMQVVQFLMDAGYAVPLYVDADHPDNGKTAIELGVAWDSTQQLPTFN